MGWLGFRQAVLVSAGLVGAALLAVTIFGGAERSGNHASIGNTR